MAQKKRNRALLCLKKKKYQTGLLAKAEGMLENVQELIDSIDFASMQADVFARLKEGAGVLKEINSQMSIEEVEDLMLDTEEAIAYQDVSPCGCTVCAFIILDHRKYRKC